MIKKDIFNKNRQKSKSSEIDSFLDKTLQNCKYNMQKPYKIVFWFFVNPTIRFISFFINPTKLTKIKPYKIVK